MKNLCIYDCAVVVKDFAIHDSPSTNHGFL